MKISLFVMALLAGFYTAEALSVLSTLQKRETSDVFRRAPSFNDLYRRKGGGGGGRSSGSSSSSSSSSGSSSGGSSGGRTSSSSNVGGSTSAGSGASRSYGGGAYYGGGATVPYTAGARSTRGIAPIALLPVAALAFFPGLWLYGAYMYPYGAPYGFYNRTAGRNESKPVNCLCQQYQPCGCDDNSDQSFLNQTIGDGSNLNSSLVRVADVNGTSQIFLNGTLPNGTTAPGGTDSGSGHKMQRLGWAVFGTIFAAAIWSL